MMKIHNQLSDFRDEKRLNQGLSEKRRNENLDFREEKGENFRLGYVKDEQRLKIGSDD